MVDDSRNLLLQFSRDRSDDAIRALVRKHSPIVYGTALRRLNGDRAAAQDVTQEVFLLLVRKASGLDGTLLSGWLYRQACRRASNYIRSEQRRKQRERIALDEIEKTSVPPTSPFLSKELDDALLTLPSADRDAIVLRFFEGKDYRSIGTTFEISEEAARKRIKRALDRLAVLLKHHGIALGGAPLEMAMMRLEATPLPDTALSAISTHVSKSLSLLGTASAIGVLKPLLAGSLVASLVAGSALAIQNLQPENPPDAAPALISGNRDEHVSSAIAPLPDGSSMEAIIAEIKRVKSGPAHSITKLRLEVILDRLDIRSIPDFVELANVKLEAHERVAVYAPLFGRWAQQDPEAAITHILLGHVGEQVDTPGNSITNNLFERWLQKDFKSPQGWLVSYWNHEDLKKDDLRQKLAMRTVDVLFTHRSGSELLAFVNTLPTPSDRAAALSTLMGKRNLSGGWESASPSRWLEFHRALQTFPDPFQRADLTTRFWRNVVQQKPAQLAELEKQFSPAEKFQVSLGYLAARYRPIVPRPGALGWEKVTDRPAREQAAMKTGIAAGIPQEELLRSIGRAMTMGSDLPGFVTWQESHPDVDLDEMLVLRVREELASSSGSIGSPPLKVAAQWAARISDPQKRLRFSRALFLRLLASDPQVASAFPSQPDLPPDVAAELRSLVEQP